MSREKTLQDFIIDLKIELEQLEEELKRFEELEKKRNEIQIVLKHAQEKYNFNSIELNKTISNSYPIAHQQFISTIDAVLEYLIEQQKTCTTREIANSIINKGTRNTPKSVLSITSTALRRLSNQNKVVQISKGYWGLPENVIGASNEREQP